ncbi:OmpA family protein [Alteromonas sp. 14N.309.X.WAT.G.H12]|uniref:OmpA family protein n=1 Tax=Alteromonas sp. 14N.309.X.WAT.G.H12 TaxID=3120824 RepID=UPI002FD46E96
MLNLVHLMILSLASNAYAGDSVEANRIQLGLEPSVQGCTFDRTAVLTHRTGPDQISGEMTVNCEPNARPYRLKSSLSPFANISLNDGRSYAVKMYLSSECDGAPLHSAERGETAVGEGRQTRWDICVKLMPLRDAPKYRLDELWPLQGGVDVYLTDARTEETLPANASIMSVYFNHNSSHLDAEAKQLMDNVVGSIKDISHFHIQLHAHTSLIGDANYNHDLSIMRLKRVREYLILNHNVDKKDTWGQAWGENRPKAIKIYGDEATENRRVDIVFIPKGSADVTSLTSAK